MTISRKNTVAREQLARQRRAEVEDRQMSALERGLERLEQVSRTALFVKATWLKGLLSDEACAAAYRRLEALMEAAERQEASADQPEPPAMKS